MMAPRRQGGKILKRRLLARFEGLETEALAALARYFEAIKSDKPRLAEAREFFKSIENLCSLYGSSENWPDGKSPVCPLPRYLFRPRDPARTGFDLGGLFGYLAKGAMPLPLIDCIGRGRPAPGPTEQRDMQTAVSYVFAARRGLIEDDQPIKAVCALYGINDHTLYDWTTKFPDIDPLAVVDGRLSRLTSALKRAAERYRAAGHAVGALRKRAKDKETPRKRKRLYRRKIIPRK